MAVAIFPIVGYTLMDYFVKYQKYAEGARHFNVERSAGKSTTSLPELTKEATQDFVVLDEQDRPLVTLSTDHIWCLRSDRNYVDVFHVDANKGVKKTTIRNTLTKLSADLPKSFLRCHRSYVVNAEGINKVSGNAQGYQLHRADFPEVPVPVSRGKSNEILDFIGK